MSLLLKVMPAALNDGACTVPRMKSASLQDDDLGTTVYVWLGDEKGRESALYGHGKLATFQAIKVAQIRDASKQKDAYKIVLSDLVAQVVQPLTTQDLGPYRHVEDADGIESLGRVHRDRNDKIVRLSSAETTVLAERFNN